MRSDRGARERGGGVAGGAAQEGQQALGGGAGELIWQRQAAAGTLPAGEHYRLPALSVSVLPGWRSSFG